MTRIKQRRGRHFIDESGRLFWINGPEENCYLSEQRQWRSGLDFDQVLEWKQCAPSGVVSQRFPSPQAACEAYEHGLITWARDLYLQRMGDQMASHRSVDDYKPTAMKLAEERGGHPRRQPWRLPEPSGPVCGLPPRPAEQGGAAQGTGGPRAEAGLGVPTGGEVTHLLRRRRSGHQLAEH
jgi:hypothetical protein